MRLRYDKDALAKLASHASFFIGSSVKEIKPQINQLLANEKITKHLEIGMGKGAFALELAHNYSADLIFACELHATVVAKIICKYQQNPCSNLKIMVLDAQKLLDVFAPQSLDVIYLNFSDPWPKRRHAHRRLVNQAFLKIYQILLKPKGQLYFKTDQKALFDYALTELRSSAWKAKPVSEDFFIQKQIPATEYEIKFKEAHKTIYFLHATLSFV